MHQLFLLRSSLHSKQNIVIQNLGIAAGTINPMSSREMTQLFILPSASQHIRREEESPSTFHRVMSLTCTDENKTRAWLHKASIIFSKTGISEPHLFFKKLENSLLLDNHLNDLKAQSEKKLMSLEIEGTQLKRNLKGIERGSLGLNMMNSKLLDAHKSTLKETDCNAALEPYKRDYRFIHEKVAESIMKGDQAKEGLEHLAELLGIVEREEKWEIEDISVHIQMKLEEIKPEQ